MIDRVESCYPWVFTPGTTAIRAKEFRGLFNATRTQAIVSPTDPAFSQLRFPVPLAPGGGALFLPFHSSRPRRLTSVQLPQIGHSGLSGASPCLSHLLDWIISLTSHLVRGKG